MGGFKGHVEVDGVKQATSAIRDAIKDGFREAGYKLEQEGKNVGRDRVAQRGRVFTTELIRGFESTNKKDGDGRVITITNATPPAKAADEGRPKGAKGPPVAALLPWVVAHFDKGYNVVQRDGDDGEGDSSYSDDTGSGGGLSNGSGDDPRDREGWFSDDVENMIPSRYHENQKIAKRHKGEILEGVVEEHNKTHLKIQWDNGNVERIHFGGNSPIVAGERFSNLPRAIQEDSVVNSWRDIPDYNGSVRSYNYKDLAAAEKQEYFEEVEALVRKTERVDLYQGAMDVLAGKGKITNKPNLGGSIARQSGDVKATREPRIFGMAITKRPNDYHLNTFDHEMFHAIEAGSGRRAYGYHHDQDFNKEIYDFDIDPKTGQTNDPSLHGQPINFAVHNQEDYDLDDSVKPGKPPGWDKIVDEVPDYIRDFNPGGIKDRDPRPQDYLEPGNNNLKEGDELVVDSDSSQFMEGFEIVNPEAQQDPNDDDLWYYEGLRNQSQSRIAVDENGDIVGESLETFTRESYEIDISDANAQRYLETDINENPEQAFWEAINRAWYTQAMASSLDPNTRNTGDFSRKTQAFTIDNYGYSTMNAQETGAVFFELMNYNSKISDSSEMKNKVEEVAEAHPYLVNTFLKIFTPSQRVIDKLEDEGVDI